jgi:hemerythrin-like domain-containing protein
MKCTELLLQDHKLILRALDVLEQMAKRVERHEPLEHDDVEVVLQFLRVFGDDFHQAREESALFPELLRDVHAQEPSLRQMLFEHDQERSLVEGLEDALYTKNGKQFTQFAIRLVELLRNHVHKEDSVLFGIVDRLLSAQQDAQIVKEFEKFHLDPVLVRQLEQLERKYIRKAAA